MADEYFIHEAESLLQETRALLARLETKNAQLLRQTQELSGKLLSLTEEHLEEAIRA